MKPSDQQPQKHAPRTCPLCSTLRHPAQAKQGRALRQHLTAHPFPRQAVSA